MGFPRRTNLIRWTKLLAALLLGDRRNTLCRVASIRTMVSRGWYWKARWPLAYALWREFHSFPLRILTIHEIEIDRRGVHMGCRKTLAEESRNNNMGVH